MTESNPSNTSGFVNTSSTSTNLMDDLVKEYLLFRGFNSCLKSFEIDSKQDKDKSLKADKIVEQLFQFIYSFDLSGLLDYWSYLDLKYFSRLTIKLPGSLSLTRKYELFLLRYYLINAIQSGKSDKALEFFETYAQKLQSQIEWKEWFCLPFLKNPEENATFAVYFSKNWIDSFYISLQNFLNIVFQSIQYPRLLNYEEDSFWLKQQQQQQHQQQLNYSTSKDDYLTDEFHQLETSNQNKTSNSLISIFKNFKTGNFAINTSSNISNSSSSNSKQTTSTRIKLFSKKSNSESTNLTTSSAVNNNSNIPKGTLKINEDANNKQIEDVAAASAQPVKQLNDENSVTIETDSLNKQKQIQESKLVQQQNELKLDSAPVRPAATPVVESSVESPFLILSEEEFREHKSSVLACKVSRDGKYVASLDTQGIAKIWSLDNKQNTLMLKGTFISVEWDKKSNKMVYLGTNKPALIKVYDLSQKKIIQEIDMSNKQANSSVILMSSMILNSKLASVVTSDNQPDFLVIFSQVNAKLSLEKQINLEVTFQVRCLAQCGHFWLGSSSGTLRAFDSDSSKFTLSVNAHKKELVSILANKDQTKLFTQSTDNTIKIWTFSSQKLDLIKSLDLHKLNLSEMNSGVQVASTSLLAADSSDNFYLLARSSVHFIEIASEKTSRFLSSTGAACTTSVEIWSASHSSILFVAYSDGLIKIYKILSHN